MRGALLLAAVLLAGCASGGVSSHTTFDEARPPRMHDNTVKNLTLASGTFSVGPDTGLRNALQVPNGSFKILMSFTFASGASTGFQAHLGPCAFFVQGALVGAGQNLTKDCGGLAPGAQDFFLDPPAGHLEGYYLVWAQICGDTYDRTGCPVPPS